MGWIAHLSTGEVVVEPEIGIKDELSPWHRLINRCRSENVHIIHLQLRKGAVLIDSIRNARGYTALYNLRTSLRGKTPTLLQGIGAIVGEMVYIAWVDDSGHVFQEVQPLVTTQVHTTERERF